MLISQILFGCSKQANFENFTFPNKAVFSPVDTRIKIEIRDQLFSADTGSVSVKVTEINEVEIANCTAVGDYKSHPDMQRIELKINEMVCETDVGKSVIGINAIVIGKDKINGINSKCSNNVCSALENEFQIYLLGTVDVSGKTILREKK